MVESCYGPAPKGYQAVDFDEDSTVVDSLDTDSIVVEADDAEE